MIDACRQWIEDALKYSRGTHTVEDVIDGIKEGRLQLWPADRGCLVTEFVEYPQKRVLNVFLGAGEMDQLTDMHNSVLSFAKENGCDAVSISGRPGWARVWKSAGFEPTHLTLEKKI